MNEIQKYIIAHEPEMMNDLFSLIRIPSISALPEHHDDMLACAERWAQLLLEAGADEALVMPSKGNPIVFAQKMVDPDAKTVLVYAHYDVMPAEPLELWKSQPFEPEIRDGYIWARGADDDKGQSFIQVKEEPEAFLQSTHNLSGYSQSHLLWYSLQQPVLRSLRQHLHEGLEHLPEHL